MALAAGALLLLPLSASAYSFETDVYDGTHKVYAIDTEHFMIEFSLRVLNGTDTDGDGIPDLVEDIAEYAEESWDVIIDDAGMPSPLDDQDIVPLILDDKSFYLWSGAIGMTSIFSNGDIYFAVDPFLSDDLLKVTTAHEFFHVVQFAYQGYFVGYDQDVNFAEMTATWAEELVYTDINDYVNYLTYYFSDPDYSVFTGVIPDGSLFEYALSVWPVFFTEYFDDWTAIPEVVDNYFNSDPDIWDTYEAYRDAAADRGSDLRDVYQMFALWNYVPTFYSDGEGYPWVDIHSYHYSDEYPLTDEQVASSDWPALFGANYLAFEIDSSDWGSDFKITLDKDSEIDLGVTVLPETNEYYLTDDMVMTMIEAGDEAGTITVPIEDDYTYVIVVVTPLAEDPSAIESEEVAFELGYEYFYSVEIGDFGGESSVETTTDSDADLGGDGDSDKEGDDAGSNSSETIDEETAFDELTVAELDITSQSKNSVSLSWTRVTSSDAAGYYVYYGTESGVYDYIEDIDAAYITHATIDDLWADTFYFVVTAYTEDGTVSEGLSNEVTATLNIPDYSDVDEGDDYYNAIRFLSYLGALEGYSDGTFGVDTEINRAELMKVMVAGILFESPDEDVYNNCFPDVNDEWFASYVCYAKEQGWVQGFDDGMFYPANTVSRAEALKMILEASEVEVPNKANLSDVPYDDIFAAAWYAPYVQAGYEMGILEEEDSFEPNEGRTRGEVSEELYRILVLVFMFEEIYTQDIEDAFLETWGEFFL